MITPGTRVGPYEILSLLGSGGMGEVFRARDTRLKRDVALKVLPDRFATDPDRLARFEREAQLLASLNHPHIAAIHGIEESSPSTGTGPAVRALVMELVEGDTLADRIALGSIPIAEALPIARQIAEALEAAHDAGIIHRDLKPANIKLLDSSQVKVLDFGLAKALDRPQAPTENSPTITSPAMTHGGVILGTAAYMSPEQARGKSVDRRADIWAFGCVLYEMLTAKRPFDGDAITEVLARVIERDPDWHALPRHCPPILIAMLRRCLQKEAGKRWHHIADARLDLDVAIAELANGARPRIETGRQSSRWREAMAWALAAIAIVVAATAMRRLATPPALEPTSRFAIAPPDGQTFGSAQAAPFPVMSPDSRRIAFLAGPAEGAPSIWVRSLDQLEPQRLAKTESAERPFWSADGRALGFTSGSRLLRVDLTGGSPQVICELPASSIEGASWGSNGLILFGTAEGIFRVAASGGVPERVTTLAANEGAHQWPVWLPDQRHFLYRAANGSIFRAASDGGTPVTLFNAESKVEFAAPDHLLFMRGTALMAQAFDPDRGELRGEPGLLVDPVRIGVAGRAAFSVSPSLLTYRSGPASAALEWDVFDRDGRAIRSLPLTQLRNFSLSPDGSVIAVHTHESNTANGELWALELQRGTLTRLTPGTSHDDFPVWSPDGRRLAISSDREGGGIWIIPADGATAPERIVTHYWRPTDWVVDGDWIVYHGSSPQTGTDIWAVSPSGDRKPRVLVQTRYEERNGVVSRDGRWLAYTSNETGRPEVYVQPFNAPGGKTLISTAGGSHARWDPNGRSLYYWAAEERVMRVPIRIDEGGIRPGDPQPMLPLKGTGGQFGASNDRSPYVLGPNGMGFIGVQAASVKGETPLTIVLNWRELLRQ